MKQTLKKIFRSPTTQTILARLGYAYLLLVFKTTRWSYVGFDHIETLIKNNQPFIGGFWHGRLAMMPFLWRWKSPFYMLLSEHSDGLFISKIVSYQHISSIYGSRTRGGARAALACVKELRAGNCIGITPDGPKGPRHQVADGVIHIARLANAPVVPISYALTQSRFLKTWDRFLVPFPFGRGVYIISAPIRIDAGKSEMQFDESKRILTDALLNVEIDADKWFQINR